MSVNSRQLPNESVDKKSHVTQADGMQRLVSNLSVVVMDCGRVKPIQTIDDTVKYAKQVVKGL